MHDKSPVIGQSQEEIKCDHEGRREGEGGEIRGGARVVKEEI